MKILGKDENSETKGEDMDLNLDDKVTIEHEHKPEEYLHPNLQKTEDRPQIQNKNFFELNEKNIY